MDSGCMLRFVHAKTHFSDTLRNNPKMDVTI
jgi:hypothetical protein